MLEHVHELAEVFRLLGDSSRLRVLDQCRDGPISVGRIATNVGLSPSLVSHHLRLLRAARIVRRERHGREIHYSLADHHIDRVLADLTEHLAEPDDETES